MNIGIIGAGLIAKTMSETIKNVDYATNYAIASRNIDKAKEYQKEYGFKVAYGSYEELVKDDNIDLIYIATPHSHHYEHAMLALRNNKPVLIEKAFCANSKQAKEILDYAKANNLFVAEAIWTRYLPSRQLIIDAINSGIIGEVTSLSANLGYKIDHIERIIKPELAGGALLDLGVYPLNFASMIFGNDIIDIQSSCVKNEFGVDIRNSQILTYKDGKQAILFSNASANSDQYGIIHGQNGYLVAHRINNINKIEIFNNERKLVKQIDIPKQITGFEYQLKACIDSINNNQIEPKQMPHSEILLMMNLYDNLRNKWNIKYPFE